MTPQLITRLECQRPGTLVVVDDDSLTNFIRRVQDSLSCDTRHLDFAKLTLDDIIARAMAMLEIQTPPVVSVFRTVNERQHFLPISNEIPVILWEGDSSKTRAYWTRDIYAKIRDFLATQSFDNVVIIGQNAKLVYGAKQIRSGDWEKLNQVPGPACAVTLVIDEVMAKPAKRSAGQWQHELGDHISLRDVVLGSLQCQPTPELCGTKAS